MECAVPWTSYLTDSQLESAALPDTSTTPPLELDPPEPLKFVVGHPVDVPTDIEELLRRAKIADIIAIATWAHHQALAGAIPPGHPAHLLWIDVCLSRRERDPEKKVAIILGI